MATFPTDGIQQLSNPQYTCNFLEKFQHVQRKEIRSNIIHELTKVILGAARKERKNIEPTNLR